MVNSEKYATIVFNKKDHVNIKNFLMKSGMFVVDTPKHALFRVKNSEVTCTFYSSGKLLLQGKDVHNIYDKIIETQLCSIKTKKDDVNVVDETDGPSVGGDESGKGDTFGPLCISVVYLNDETFKMFQGIAKDSKKIKNDSDIVEIANKIRQHCVYKESVIYPYDYNIRYEEKPNLNLIMSEEYNKLLSSLFNEVNCNTKVIIDKFTASESQNNIIKFDIGNVTIVEKAERFLSVACASILARDNFLKSLSQMSNEWKINFPKGSNNVNDSIIDFIKIHGVQNLKLVSKCHFKNIKKLIDGSKFI